MADSKDPSSWPSKALTVGKSDWQWLSPERSRYGSMPLGIPSLDVGFRTLPSAKVYASRSTQLREHTPALLFLHGVGSSQDAWRNVVTVVGDRAECHLFDFPGFGGTQKQGPGVDTAYFAKVVHEYIEKVIGRDTVIISHSMGSIVALHYLGSGDVSKHVRGLVSTSGTMMSVLDFYHHPMSRLLQAPGAALAYLLQIVGSSLPIPASLALRLLAVPAAKHALLGKHIAFPDELHKTTINRFAESLGGLDRINAAKNGFGYDYKAIYRNIQTPLVLINGEQDGLVTLSDVDSFCALAAKAPKTVTIIRDVGHWPAEEQCAFYTEVLLSSARSLAPDD